MQFVKQDRWSPTNSGGRNSVTYHRREELRGRAAGGHEGGARHILAEIQTLRHQRRTFEKKHFSSLEL